MAWAPRQLLSLETARPEEVSPRALAEAKTASRRSPSCPQVTLVALMEPLRQPISQWVPRSSSAQRKAHATPSFNAALLPITAVALLALPQAKTRQTLPRRSRSMAAWSRLRASSTSIKSVTRRQPTATRQQTRRTTWRTFRLKSAVRIKLFTELTQRSDRMEASASVLCLAVPEAM